MKQVFSVSLDEKTIAKIHEILEDSSFRNKSHLVEEAIKKFLRENGH
ncbi:ribbon-helix-helix protein, CopG family [Candidatus Woesearchaeota archaeon]|nr:ribbon-helix-helix protein, CopG family [Candidatus Woesearchaeota archaeon]